MPLNDRPCTGLASALHRPCLESPPPEVAQGLLSGWNTYDLVIARVDAAKSNGRTGGWLLIVSGDDFKLVRIAITNGFVRSFGNQASAVGYYGAAAIQWLLLGLIFGFLLIKFEARTNGTA
jgi:hypothetical protein